MDNGLCSVCNKNPARFGSDTCGDCNDKRLEKFCKKEPYSKLQNILNQAYEQASQGKGKERHANDKDFDKQPICEIGRMVGLGYNLGQAMKKSQESLKLLEIRGKEAARNELLGAINYLSSAIILIDEMEDKQ